MKVVSWNVEWMNNWFVGGGRVALRESYAPRGRPGDAITDVRSLCQRVAQVLLDLDADLVCIQEGPSDLREMNLFLSEFVTQPSGVSYQPFVGEDGSSQKLYVLVRQGGRLSSARLADDEASEDLGHYWVCDVEGTLQLYPYRFTRRPLVVDVNYEGQDVRVVTLHTKSKHVQGGAALWDSENGRDQYVRQAIKQRRRIAAESMRVRRYLDGLLDHDPHWPIIVAGDLNDGPGADYFEELYLTHNVTDIVLGSTFRPAQQFEHAFLDHVPRSQRYTARFDDFVTGQQNNGLVLDHILVSPALKSASGSLIGLLQGGIAHEIVERLDEPTSASARERQVSDHRPVYAVFGP